MVRDTQADCPFCTRRAVHGFEDRCRSCGRFVGFPNVRRAELERSQLSARYSLALNVATAHGCDPERRRLEEIAKSTVVVKSEPICWTSATLRREDTVFANYHQLIHGSRFPAQPSHDAQRLRADASLYGSYGKEIVFAALSADGFGLPSYGNTHVEFFEDMVAHRSTVCEENAYILHRTLPPSDNGLLPPGYIAAWDDRDKIAVVKNAPRLSSKMADGALAALIASPGDNRGNDRVLEVHVHSPLGVSAVAKIRVKKGEEFSQADDLDLRTLTLLASARRIPLEVH